MRWQKGENDREFLVYARTRVVDAIAVAEERGGCTRDVMDKSGHVCAIGALAVSRLKLKKTPSPNSLAAQHFKVEAYSATDNDIWSILPRDLFGRGLPGLNDDVCATQDNPATAALSMLLRKIDARLACLGVANHELQGAKP